MVVNISPHQYYSELLRRGGSASLFDKIREVDEVAAACNVRPVYTLTHLAILCGLPLHTLMGVIESSDEYYEEFKIRKKSVKRKNQTRLISAPIEELKTVQSTILRVVSHTSQVSKHAFAYVPGRSTVGAVQCHMGAQSLVRLDIKEFFNNIKSASVYKAFVGLGYPRLLAFQMMLFTTRGIEVFVKLGRSDGDNLYDISGKGYLPQGAPTSGVLSNLVFAELDCAFSRTAMRMRAAYTRYADDMHFSFPYKISSAQVAELVATVSSELNRNGYELNIDKTQVQRNPKGIRILGLCLSEDRVGITKNYKYRILGLLHAIEKYGLASVAERNNCRDDIELAHKLHGHFCYIYSVDRKFASLIGYRVETITSGLV